MKKVYWRPRNVSRVVLVLLAVLSVAGLAAVERFRVHARQPYYQEKIAASQLAKRAMDHLLLERRQLSIEIDPEADPLQSGLIGAPMSPVTSDPGVLSAKQTTINPNWAAVIVEMLREAGVQPGDTVAVGCSGSFPALNVSTYAAIETLNVRPVVIASAAASQWGANIPGFLWIDMERVLQRDGVFRIRSVAASIGGIQDRGLGMSEEGRGMLVAAVERNGLPVIHARTLAENVTQRMQIFREKASGKIGAYINLGGGTTSVGSSVGKRLFQPGLNLHPPAGASAVDSVMSEFIESGVPVIHLVQIERLAERYGLPIQPHAPEQVEVGKGPVYERDEYNRGLALGILVFLLAAIYVCLRTEAGTRLLATPFRSENPAENEPMI